MLPYVPVYHLKLALDLHYVGNATVRAGNPSVLLRTTIQICGQFANVALSRAFVAGLFCCVVDRIGVIPLCVFGDNVVLLSLI